jgi:hypothetical protein
MGRQSRIKLVVVGLRMKAKTSRIRSSSVKSLSLDVLYISEAELLSLRASLCGGSRVKMAFYNTV